MNQTTAQKWLAQKEAEYRAVLEQNIALKVLVEEAIGELNVWVPLQEVFNRLPGTEHLLPSSKAWLDRARDALEESD